MHNLDGARASSLQGNKILYFHVPKCGGTTIRTAFTALYGLMAENQDGWASRRAAKALGADLLDVREHWMVYHLARARAPFIGGHFPWSPALDTLAGDYRLVTMLREPRAHFLSDFFWNRDKPKRQSYPIAQNTVLKDFVHSERAVEIGSKFVSYFTDPHLRRTPTDSDAIEAACRNLMTIDVVGTLEHFDDLVAEIDQLIGRQLQVGHERVSPTSKANQDAEIDDDALAAIDELCRPNRAVYDAARRWPANRS